MSDLIDIPMDWYYISFANDDEFLGALLIKATAPQTAPLQASIEGLNPGGEAMILGPLPSGVVEENIPEEMRGRILSEEDLRTTGELIQGTVEEIEDYLNG